MIKGIDISHWNDVNVITKNKDDIEFVICKASEGRKYADHTAPRFAEQALKEGKLLGFYHYARPDTSTSATDEAHNFLSRIQSYVDTHQCFMALDWEGKSLKYPTDWAIRWLDYVYNNTGVKPMLYCSSSSLDQMKEVAKHDYGLWVAKWIRSAGINTIPTVRPPKGAWKVWAIWQYTNTRGKLDVDLFNGTREQLMKYM